MVFFFFYLFIANWGIVRAQKGQFSKAEQSFFLTQLKRSVTSNLVGCTQHTALGCANLKCNHQSRVDEILGIESKLMLFNGWTISLSDKIPSIRYKIKCGQYKAEKIRMTIILQPGSSQILSSKVTRQVIEGSAKTKSSETCIERR